MPELKVDQDPEKTISLIQQEVEKHLNNNKFIVMLGGEHSITTGLVRAYKNKYLNMSVLQFDAHSDLREEFEGTKYSHAAVMSRITEICPAVQVGIRSMSVEESEKIKQGNLDWRNCWIPLGNLKLSNSFYKYNNRLHNWFSNSYYRVYK